MNNKETAPAWHKYIILFAILIAAAIALLVSSITGDQTVWAYMIPIGVACGVAIQSGLKRRS